VLHRFTSYASVWFGHWESDLSWDGDHLPVVGDDRWGFIYRLSTGGATAVQDLLAVTGGVAVDVFDLTPSNRAMVRWGNLNGGVAYFDEFMSPLGKVTGYAGHSDRARDADGADLEVAVNAADLAPPAGCANAIVKVRLADRTQTCLRAMDWSLAQHVSCNNVGQGWCLVSTYNGVPGAVGYANELLQVKLDGSQTARLAHSRSTNAGYDHYPRAAVSGDGRYVLFDSDMQGATVDVYVLEVGQSAPPPPPGDSPSPMALSLTANRETIAAGETVQLSVTAANPGPATLVDVYFGALLPPPRGPEFACLAGDALQLYVDGFARATFACLATVPRGLEALQRNILVPAGMPPTTFANFFASQWTADRPAGTHIFFMALIPSGALADGRIDAGDLLALATLSIRMGP
jgi:uncharacterized repeat protein (TIGR01451 family)